MNFITINMKVQRANIKQSSYLVSPVVPFPAAMFVHNLSRKLNITLNEFFYIHHDYNVYGYEKKYDVKFAKQVGFNYVSVKSNQNVTARTQPEMLSDLYITIGIKISNDVNIHKINNFVRGSRIAGGTISNFNIDILQDIHITNDLPPKIKRGFFLIDRKDLLQDKEDKLGVMLSHIDIDTRTENWLVPTSVGYMNLEQPVKRKTSRTGTQYDHAFVESVIGLTQLVSVHSTTTLPLWSYSSTNNINVITQGN